MTGAGSGWRRFWSDAPTAAGGATLANLPPQLQQRLDAPWSRLAAALPHRAKVLDLATGGGIVLTLLRQRRATLVLTGVDAAARLPQMAGMTLKGGVHTERLPFRDGSFAAVTSRFGIEYGPLDEGAAEAARVCRSDGQICFIVHHADSPVLRHNRDRARALRWVAHDSGWMDKAANLVRARATTALPTPDAFRTAAHEAEALFPGQSVVGEFLVGLVQLLDAGLGRPGVALPGLDALTERANEELGRLEALFGAACDALRLNALTDALSQGGFSLAPVATIDDRPGGDPLAWLIEGRRL